MTSGRQTRVRVGGWSLIAATILFAAVFSYLAGAFDYPEVLDGSAADVLPRLLALGGAGRAVWFVYGFIPLLLVPTGRGVDAAARIAAPRLGTVALSLAGLSAAAMMTGLLRWPTLHWSLAQTWEAASPASRDGIATTFATANRYLGNVIGEFLGELFLNGFFLVASLAIAAAAPHRRWLIYAGGAASVLGWIAMLRNITPLVASAADANNIVLPLWMLTLGIALVTTRTDDTQSSGHERSRS
jgi:hypothetical protein